MSELCPFRARFGHCRECDYYYMFGCNEEEEINNQNQESKV